MDACPEGHVVPEGAQFCGICGLAVVRHGATRAPAAIVGRQAWTRERTLIVVLAGVASLLLIITGVALTRSNSRTVASAVPTDEPIVTSIATETPITQEPLAPTDAPPALVVSTTDSPVVNIDAVPSGTLEVVGGGLSLANHSYDNGYDVSVVGILRNPTALTATDITVNLNLIDGAGHIVKSETDTTIDYIGAGAEAYATDDVFLDDGAPLPKSIEVQAKADNFDNTRIDTFAFSDMRYTSDDTGATVQGSIQSSSSDDIDQVEVKCALFSGAKPIGGGYTFVDLVPAGKTTGFQVLNGLVEGLSVSSIRCYGTH